jgi:hypothetical protein
MIYSASVCARPEESRVKHVHITEARICYGSFCLFVSSIIICWLCKLTLSDQAQITLLIRASVSNLVWRFVVSLPRWVKKLYFHWDSNPLLATLCVWVHYNCAANNLSTSVTKPNMLRQYIAKVAVCRRIHKKKKNKWDALSGPCRLSEFLNVFPILQMTGELECDPPPPFATASVTGL